MLRQLPILQQVFNFQCLYCHRLVFVNKLSGQVVLVIRTGIREVFMCLGKLEASLCLPLAPLLASGQGLLLASKIGGGMVQKAGIRYFPTL